MQCLLFLFPAQINHSNGLIALCSYIHYYRFNAGQSPLKIRKWLGWPRTGSESPYHYLFVAGTGSEWTVTYHCRCGAITVGLWLPTVIYKLSTKSWCPLLPPLSHPEHTHPGGARFPHSLHCCGLSSPWSSWILKHGHDLHPLRLLISIHSFDFIALPLFWWLYCLIFILVVSPF